MDKYYKFKNGVIGINTDGLVKEVVVENSKYHVIAMKEIAACFNCNFYNINDSYILAQELSKNDKIIIQISLKCTIIYLPKNLNKIQILKLLDEIFLRQNLKYEFYIIEENKIYENITIDEIIEILNLHKTKIL